MSTDPAPGKFWAYVSVIVGGLLLLSGAATACSYLGVPFIVTGRDVFSLQLGQMAAIFLGLVCGPLALYHGARSILNRASGPMRLPPVYAFWIIFALTLGLGQVLLSFHISEQYLFPPLFLLGAALPTLSVIAWAGRRLGWPITWRQGALALAAGSTLSIFMAIALEVILSLIAYFLVPPLGSLMNVPSSDLLTRLFFSPILVVFLIATALEAPIPEEFSKALGAILFGRKRILNERQAFAIGLVCGAGFAILENMLYESIYATRGGWGWGGVTLLRGLGAVLHPIGTGLIALGWFRMRERGWIELLKAYALAVGLHTLWNGGFAALVYLTGLEYYSRSGVLSLYGMPVQVGLIAFLVALALGLWGLLRVLVVRLAKEVELDLSPAVVSRRAVAVWACACAFVIVPLGASLGPAWGPIQGVVLAGLPTPTARPTQTLTPTLRPTFTPSPTRTSTPALLATATAQAAYATATAAGQRRALLAETFDSNQRQWPTGPADTEYWEGTQTIEKSKYRWEAQAKRGFVSRSSPDSGAVSAFDYSVTVEAQRITGNSTAEYGVYLRESGSDYYLFLIADDQSYNFSVRYQSKWITIIPTSHTSAIRPDEMNKITVIVQGTHFTFLINDKYVAEAEDDRIGQGFASIAIELSSGDSAVIEFDNLEMHSL